MQDKPSPLARHLLRAAATPNRAVNRTLCDEAAQRLVL